MKAHIYFSQGLWMARFPWHGRRHAFYGIGSSPADAYQQLLGTMRAVCRA